MSRERSVKLTLCLASAPIHCLYTRETFIQGARCHVARYSIGQVFLNHFIYSLPHSTATKKKMRQLSGIPFVINVKHLFPYDSVVKVLPLKMKTAGEEKSSKNLSGTPEDTFSIRCLISKIN